MSAIIRARSFAVLSIMLAAAILGGMLVSVPSADAATRGKRISTAVDIVRNQKGDPYQYGATGPSRFDCSGLIYYSYRRAGFTHVPRTSSQQARFADRISRKNMRPGDLMFFHDGGGVYHVAVFTGWKNGRRWMVHAPSTGSRVHRSTPWTNSWFAGTLR
ncbi:MAG TPA: C40 family peptidase [Pedococcus sp.]|nr:C40 family peptidase [Pedococcus sp.]